MVREPTNGLAVLGFHQAGRTHATKGRSPLSPPRPRHTTPTTTRRRRRGYWTPPTAPGWIRLTTPPGRHRHFSRLGRSRRSTAPSAGGVHDHMGLTLSRSATRTTRYRIVGRSGGLIDVGRLYLIKGTPPATPARVPVGSRLTRRFPRPSRWANNGRSFDILPRRPGSSSGVNPARDHQFPVPVRIVPSLPGRFSSPDQFSLHRQPAFAVVAYPADPATGKPVDVRVAVAAWQPGALSDDRSVVKLGRHRLYRLGLQREGDPPHSWTYSSDDEHPTAASPRNYLDVIRTGH